MENQIKSFICENCEQKFIESGISRLYEVAWQYAPQTKSFEFAYAGISDRKEGDFICNHCGEHVTDDFEAMNVIQDIAFEQAPTAASTDDVSTDFTCESCDEALMEVGVSQLWDVDWKWSEDEQRFVFDQAYASELDDYAICCNGCGHEIEDELPLATVQVKGL